MCIKIETNFRKLGGGGGPCRFFSVFCVFGRILGYFGKFWISFSKTAGGGRLDAHASLSLLILKKKNS